MARRKTESLKEYRKRRGRGNKWKATDPIGYHRQKQKNRQEQERLYG